MTEGALLQDPFGLSGAVLEGQYRADDVVGEGGFARRSQSGGVRNTRLPHSGLVLTLPRFILDPPAGRAPGALLEAEALPPALLPLRDDILSKPI